MELANASCPLVLLAGCGSSTAEDFEALARSDRWSDIEQAWSAGDPAVQGTILDGVAASESGADFLAARAVEGNEQASKLLLRQDQAAVAEALEAILLDGPADQDEPATQLLADCCPEAARHELSRRVDALFKEATQDAATRAARMATAMGRDRAHPVLLEEVPAALQAKAGASSCRIGALLSDAELPSRAALLDAVAPPLQPKCTTASGVAAVQDFMMVVERSTSSDAARPIHQLVEEWAQAASDADASRTREQQARTRVEEVEESLRKLETSLRDMKRESGVVYLRGQITGTIGDRAYDVAVFGSRERVLLRTTDTEFTTTGNFAIWVVGAGTEPVQMKNGFVQDVQVAREHTLIPAAEQLLKETRAESYLAKEDHREARNKLRAATRREQAAESHAKQALGTLSLDAPVPPPTKPTTTATASVPAHHPPMSQENNATTARVPPRTPKGNAVLGLPNLSGMTEGAADFQASVRANVDGFNRCYREALTSTPDLSGSVAVAWTVEGGATQEVSSSGAPPGQSKLAACLERVAASINMEPAVSGSASWPIYLRPQ